MIGFQECGNCESTHCQLDSWKNGHSEILEK